MSRQQGQTATGPTVVGGFFWSYAGRASAQIVSFVVSVLLARRLMPEVFDAFLLMMVLIFLGNVLTESGFFSALIQKRDATELDFSTAFWFCLCASVLIYAVLFVCAPALAAWLGGAWLTPLIRVLSLSIVVQAVNTLQRAALTRAMAFRTLFAGTLCGTVAGAVASIALAYGGFGAWALVSQHLVATAVETVAFALLCRRGVGSAQDNSVGSAQESGVSSEQDNSVNSAQASGAPALVRIARIRRPAFCWANFRALYAYGWKVFCVSLMDVLYDNGRSLAIGKLFSAGNLAFYNRGKQYPDLVVSQLDASMNSVLFPAMSREQDDPARVKRLVRGFIGTGTYLLCPLLIGMAVVARPLIALMLTDKWLGCVPVLQIYCLAYVLKPLQSAGVQVTKALGRSDMYLRRDLFKKLFGVALMIAAIAFFRTIEAVALSYLIAVLLNAFVDFLPCRRLLGYTFVELAADLAPTLLLSAGMAVAAYAVSRLALGNLPALALEVLLAVATYLLLSILTKNRNFHYLLGILRARMLRK